MYKRKKEGRSRNHFVPSKKKSITCYECAFVALLTQSAKCICRITSRPATCLALPYFSTLIRRRDDFRKKRVMGHKICFLVFSTTFGQNISYSKKNAARYHPKYTGVLISPQPDQEGNKLQRQKILSFIYPIYNHNWRNISYIYIYKKTDIKRNILTTKQNTGKQVGLRTYQHPCINRGADKSLARPGRKQATATEDFEFHISYL